MPAPAGAECGQPVPLLLGFLAEDGSLRILASALRATGYQPHTAGLRCNVGCSEATVRRITAAVDRLTDRFKAESRWSGIAAAAWSRGGARISSHR